MVEGVTLAYRARLADGEARSDILTNHMWLQVTSGVLVCMGFGAIYANKALNDKEHFVSLHGKLGAMTAALTVLLLALGSLSFRKLGLIHVVPTEYHSLLKWMHRVVRVQ